MIFNFEAGDFLLHPKYGLGRFLGIEFITLQSSGYEFAKLEYANSTYIYVPIFNLDILKFHTSRDKAIDDNLEVEAIGASKVLKKKEKLKEDIHKVAVELAKIRAARKLMKVDKFTKPKNYEDFEKGFEFDLTVSQVDAQEDILNDLAKSEPMDRLICADVGFGKTELALRAAFIVSNSGRQVLLIAPTTILAQQHYDLCIERFKDFDIKCALNSRFNKGDLADWLEGKVDILVTTISNKGVDNLRTHNIGLVILDEEQHFGAKIKEQLRNIGHFLQLSATPIPRTLNLSLSGIKDISILDIPPFKRKETSVEVIFDSQIDDAGKFNLEQIVRKELDADGRVFLVAPRVNYIEGIEKQVAKFNKPVDYVVIHGKLPAEKIKQGMSDFKSGKKPLLIGTNIIESGLNIEHANLMVIFQSHMFGISQLYQLRGRVGRLDKAGKVYLLSPDNLKDMAIERLQSIAEHTYLGANFSMAQHDLSMRGGGSVLGTNQSGKDYGFGMEMYYHMLATELKALNDEDAQDDFADFYMQFDGFDKAFIPSEFIAEEKVRLDFYKKFSKVLNQKELDKVKNQLESFLEPGQKLPVAVENFCNLIKMKYLSKQYSINYSKFYKDAQQPIKRLMKKADSYLLVLDKSHDSKILHKYVLEAIDSVLKKHNISENIKFSIDSVHHSKPGDYKIEFKGPVLSVLEKLASLQILPL